METQRLCPNCRKPLPPDVPLGLCPECLIKAGFPTGTEPGTGGAGRFVPPSVEEIAKLFPQFEIISLIGRGGMGAVYKARQPGLDRFIALKVLPPAVANDPGFAERFNREARALARLSHPNIVAVYDFGKAAELHYLVMEFVDGANLREVERAGRLSPEQALAIVPQICEALQFAHNEGIVHRDIKPENLLLDKKGRVKITDFGIAKIIGVTEGKASLTGAKDIMGTPHYMAPEQIEKPQAVDHRADIYSLGVVFYEMLTGELPLGKFAPPSKKAPMDARLDEVVMHTLEKEPDRRYQQASQVKTDVETIATGGGAPLPPPGQGAAKMGGAAPPPQIMPLHPAMSDRVILPAFLLAFFFGIFGAHRFYVGKIRTGILQLAGLGGCVFLVIICATTDLQPAAGILLATLICACGAWAVIDWIMILCKVFTDGSGRRLVNWWHPHPNAPQPPASSQPPTPPGPPKAPVPPIAGAAASGGSSPMIIAPAIALIIAGCLKLFGSVIGLLFLLSSGATEHKHFPFFVPGLTHFLPPVVGVAALLFSVIPAAVIIYGGVQMLRLRSYAWAMAAAIVAIIFCSLLGTPVGIWALIVLLMTGVRERFGNRLAAPASVKGLWILGAVAVLCLLLFFPIIFVTLLAHTHHGTAASSSFASRLTRVMQVPPVPATQPIAPTPPVLPAAPQPPISVTTTGSAPLSYQWYTGSMNNTTTLLTYEKDDAGDSPDFSKSFAVDPHGDLTMDVDRGDVRITGSDGNTVEVHVERNVKVVGNMDASETLKKEHVVIEHNGNQISITAQNPFGLHSSLWNWWSQHLDVHYEITVPRGFTVESKTSGGDIRVSDVQSNVIITTAGGDLECMNLGGDVNGKTMGGGVRAGGCHGALDLQTMGGDITVENFSGPGVQAATSGGSVSADFVTAPTADCELYTIGGNVTVRLPDTAAVILDGHTTGGEVKTDFPIKPKEGFGSDSLEGPVNVGPPPFNAPTLKMDTTGGSIEVSKR
jgi:TM2 domain-containing membrane protein YozV/predicted Ser/Thr protein kinase